MNVLIFFAVEFHAVGELNFFLRLERDVAVEVHDFIAPIKNSRVRIYRDTFFIFKFNIARDFGGFRLPLQIGAFAAESYIFLLELDVALRPTLLLDDADNSLVRRDNRLEAVIVRRDVNIALQNVDASKNVKVSFARRNLRHGGKSFSLCDKNHQQRKPQNF